MLNLNVHTSYILLQNIVFDYGVGAASDFTGGNEYADFAVYYLSNIWIVLYSEMWPENFS